MNFDAASNINHHNIIMSAESSSSSSFPAISSLDRHEQDFLNSRKARVEAVRSDFRQRQHRQSDDLHKFWSTFRRLLKDWEGRLDRLTVTPSRTDSSSSRDSVINNNDIHYDDDDKDPCQELQNLKEELRLIQHHVLRGERNVGVLGVTSPSVVVEREKESNGHASERSAKEGWPVPPEDFPLADVRLLHSELSRCFTKWEDVSVRILPVRTFRFTRYREELARRMAMDKNCLESTIADDSNNCSHPQNNTAALSSQSAQCPAGDDGGESHNGHSETRMNHDLVVKKNDVSDSCIQNFSNVAIVIDSSGGVAVQTNLQNDGDVLVKDDDNPSSIMGKSNKILVGTALLLRNLEHCNVIINLNLVPALHIVGMRNCHLRFGDDSKVESAIHITDCHHSSIMATNTGAVPTVQDGEQSSPPTGSTAIPGTTTTTTTTTGPQQIRIHESSHLEISFHLPQVVREDGICGVESLYSSHVVPLCRTAVILENSIHIVFRMLIHVTTGLLDSSEESTREDVEDKVATNGNTLLEVKDFNWLRTGIPSPNFEIKEEISWGGGNIRRNHQSKAQTLPHSDHTDKSTASTKEATKVLSSTAIESYLNEIETGVSDDCNECDDEDEL